MYPRVPRPTKLEVILDPTPETVEISWGLEI